MGIQIARLDKTFKDGFKKNKVLFDLSFSVEDGEIFGFLGPNGAGKSTTIKLLLDFIRPDSGEMKVNGAKVGREVFQHHIGYLPESPCFYENLTGRETLYFAGRASGMTKGAVQEASREVLKRLDLDHAADRPIQGYSKGMKQRLGFAQALVHDPAIFILDEPMSGLDPMGRRLVADVILELKGKGKTVFFSSHILSDVETLCDRIGILNKGKLLCCGTVDDFAGENGNLETSFMELIEEDERSRS